jgi:hypothetical protein
MQTRFCAAFVLSALFFYPTRQLALHGQRRDPAQRAGFNSRGQDA